MRYVVAALLALIVICAVAVDQIFKWENECEAHGGTAQSQEVGQVGSVPIVEAWCEAPNGERLEW